MAPPLKNSSEEFIYSGTSSSAGSTDDVGINPAERRIGEMTFEGNSLKTEKGSVGAAEVTPFERDDGTIIGHWEERLTMFEKLILVKIFMEEKVRMDLIQYFQHNCNA